MRNRIDALMPSMPNRIMLRTNGAPAYPKGWIGINAQGPRTIDFRTRGLSRSVLRLSGHHLGRSRVSREARRDCPGDVLIAYDGVDVKGHRFDLTQMLVPDKKLAVAVRHDGEAKEYTLTVAQAPGFRCIERQLDAGRPRSGSSIQRVVPGDAPRRQTVFVRSVAAARRERGGARVGMLIPVRTFFLSPNGAFGADPLHGQTRACENAEARDRGARQRRDRRDTGVDERAATGRRDRERRRPVGRVTSRRFRKFVKIRARASGQWCSMWCATRSRAKSP